MNYINKYKFDLNLNFYYATLINFQNNNSIVQLKSKIKIKFINHYI